MLRRSSLISSILSLAAFLILSVSACSGPDHSERLAKVDSLQKRTKRLGEQLGELDTGRIKKLMEGVDRQLELFKAHFERDSMGEELARGLNDHKHTADALEGYGSILDRLVAGIDTSEKKLKALEKDLKKGRHTKKEAKKYISDEKKVLDQLEDSMNELEKRSKAALRSYERYSGILRENLTLPDSVEWPAPVKQ
jgi:DNA repair ATPase RecN